MKYTPENIQSLKRNQVFVFGSNEAGIHGAGAAKLAVQFGAKMGQGFGLAGQTFAIPTKDWRIQTLELKVIDHYIARFIDFAETQPDWEFLVTKIGCGLAGYQSKNIAPIFMKYILPENIVLPAEFWSVTDPTYI